MAKNLKLNIKNAQLAEALKINQIKKPAAAKKGSKADQQESKVEETKQISSAEAASQVPAQEQASTKPAITTPLEKAPSEPHAAKETVKPFEEKAPIAPPAPSAPAPSSYESGPRGSYEERPPQSQYQQGRSFDRRPPGSSGYQQSGPRYGRPHGDRPGYQGQQSSETRFSRPQGSQTGDTRFSRPQGSQTGDTRFSRPQGSQTGDTRFSRPQGSQTGDTRFSRPQGSQTGDTRFSRPQGSQTGDTRFSRPPFDRSGPRPQGGQYGAPRPPFRREGLPPPDVKKAFPSSKDHPVREAPPVKKPETEEDKFPRKSLPQKDGKDQKAAKKVDAHKSFDSRDRHGLRAGDEEVWRKKKTFKSKQQMQEEVIRPKNLKVRLPISVKDLAAEMKLKASQLIAKLFMQGVAITLNDLLDDETTVQLLGHEFECEISIDTAEEKRIQVTDKSIKEEIMQAPQSALHLRPPVVTFMGHVDHGKTSLIDAIRKSNRVASEAGAITQHIGAFKCHTAVGDITVLDTPGHEAFSAMRSRGAGVTDIAVLVVAGDEGMKAQTLEALSQAQAASVPIVVAINKCDRPGFNAENVYRQLADNNLLPEAWGGATITVNCSAITGEGIKDLLEMLALQAEVLELRANPEARARGSVIESEMHKGLGAVATILVQNGTLRVGDSIVFGQHYARVKTMHDEFGKELTSAGPSTPVKITGLSNLAGAGSEFVAVKDEKEAREISEKRAEGHKSNLLLQSKKGSLENLLQQRADKVERKTLNLIVKADVQGSLEALKTSLLKIPSKKVELCFISEGVGEISESDIQFAATSKATIIGFHTKIESHAEGMIKQLKVNVRLHDIIYHAVDDTRELMLSLLDKIAQENEIGKAEVRTVFKSSHLGNIAGCQVAEGTVKRSCIVKVMRDKEQVWKGPIASLKRVKEDVKEVSKGIECGIVLQNFGDIRQGDMIHAIEVTYLTQDLN